MKPPSKSSEALLLPDNDSGILKMVTGNRLSWKTTHHHAKHKKHDSLKKADSRSKRWLMHKHDYYESFFSYSWYNNFTNTFKTILYKYNEGLFSTFINGRRSYYHDSRNQPIRVDLRLNRSVEPMNLFKGHWYQWFLHSLREFYLDAWPSYKSIWECLCLF